MLAPAAFVPDLKGRHAVDWLTIPACLICIVTFWRIKIAE